MPATNIRAVMFHNVRTHTLYLGMCNVGSSELENICKDFSICYKELIIACLQSQCSELFTPCGMHMWSGFFDFWLIRCRHLRSTGQRRISKYSIKRIYQEFIKLKSWKSVDHLLRIPEALLFWDNSYLTRNCYYGWFILSIFMQSKQIVIELKTTS